jgi:hypothetical protein
MLHTPANEFSWIPFATLIEADDRQYGLLIILDKFCYYGTAICVIRFGGLRLRTATIVLVATLACAEVAVLAALAGVAFRAVERERRSAERHLTV